MALFNFFQFSILSLILIIGLTCAEEQLRTTKSARERKHVFETTVVGNYEGIIVRANNTVDLSGNRHLPIEWINPYVFYFKWASSGNEEIWIYDTTSGCLYQIYNKIKLDIFTNRSCKRLSPVEPVQEVGRNLGNFRSAIIYANTINVSGKTLPITWINAYVFYFYYDAANLQFWVYDAEIESYLQLGTWNNSVTHAHARLKHLTHSRF